MKKIYSKGLLIIGLLAIFSSCSDALDLQPETTWAVDDFYKNETDINAALAGIHSAISGGTTFGRQLLVMDAGTDESFYTKKWNESYPVSLMSHNASTKEVKEVYRDLYGGINNANNLIKYINPDSFEDEEVYNKYLGEAKFLRGFMYYHLTLWYNEIPLRLEPTRDQSSNHMAPSPVTDIYEQIIADLTFAAENLPRPFDGGYVHGHANSMAAHAMLAKVYLKAAGYPAKGMLDYSPEINGKNKYQAAKDHCAIIMNDGSHSLNPDYKELFLNYIQNRFDLSETLFEIVYRNSADLGVGTSGSIGWTNGLNYNIETSKIAEPYSSPDISPSPVVENTYNDEEEGELKDLRKSWNIPGYSGNKNVKFPNGKVIEQHSLSFAYTIGKFRRWDAAFPDDLEKTNEQLTPIIVLETPEPIDQHGTGINLPVIRFSDVLLMFAEAENELNGPSGEAQAAIDLVRNRAGLENLATAKPEAIAGHDAFFNEIVDERLRELCFEGHRKADLIRWNLLGEKLQVLHESIIYHPEYTPSDANPKFRCYTNFDPSKHLSLPYPEQEVQLNNLLDQKDEW